MLGLKFQLGHLDHFGLQLVDLVPAGNMRNGFYDVQNVPPPMPSSAVNFVNWPSAGVVRPMVDELIVEFLIATLEIVPPLMIIKLTVCDTKFGF